MLFIVFMVELGWKGKRLEPVFKTFNEKRAVDQLKMLQGCQPKSRFSMDVIYDPKSKDLEDINK